jgi:hypothetical protein
MQISSISVIKTTERKAAMWLVNFKILIFITVEKLPKNKKIKRADQILPEVYGTTLKTVNRRTTDNTTANRKRTN